MRVLCVADVRGKREHGKLGRPATCRRGTLLRFSPILTVFFFCWIGNLKSLNELAKQARADHIIHTGDFGFYDDTSLERIADK